jgi:hypothetical protein
MKIPSPNDVTPTIVDVEDVFKPQPKFSQEDLQMAFNLVKDKEHWKNPIHVEITDKLLVTENGLVSLKDMVDAAVIHFTGGVATFTSIGNGKYLVDAVGYYVSCPEY